MLGFGRKAQGSAGYAEVWPMFGLILFEISLEVPCSRFLVQSSISANSSCSNPDILGVRSIPSLISNIYHSTALRPLHTNGYNGSSTFVEIQEKYIDGLLGQEVV